MYEWGSMNALQGFSLVLNVYQVIPESAFDALSRLPFPIFSIVPSTTTKKNSAN
jgi:hypothetical protein